MPMKIVNVMWAGGSPYQSVHKVHQQILSQAGADASIANWVLLSGPLCCGQGSIKSWNVPQKMLKGRHLWRLLHPWLRARLRRELVQFDADAVLLDGIGVARLLLPVLQQLPTVRATVIFHGATRLRAQDIQLLRSIPVERLNVVAVSQTLAQALEPVLGRSVKNLRVALDPQRFTQALLGRREARDALGVQPEARRVLAAVGRLVDSKGFELLVDAFYQARQRHPDLYLVILGEGELRARLQAQITRLGLDHCLQLSGHRPDMQRLYRAFDWLLVPSRSEGLGLVVQEAVLADVPVICSDLPVFREQLGDAGRYHPAADTAAWVEAIALCAERDGSDVAAAQRQVLAPEQSWQAFCEGSASLLRR